MNFFRRLTLRARAELALVLITLIWGSTFVTVRATLGQVDPLSFLGLRFAAGAVAMLPFALRYPIGGRMLRHGFFLGMLLFAGYGLQTWGLAFTTASRSAFITGLSVVLVPLVALLLFRRRPSAAAVAGVLLASAGLWLFTQPGAAAAGSARTLAGDALTTGCAVVYAFYIVLTEKYSREHAAIPFVAVQLGVVTLFCAAARPFVPGFHAQLSTLGVMGIIYCGVVATAFAIGLQTWAQAHTSSIRAALIYALEPVFASALAAGLGLEHLGVAEMVGGALIVGGVLVSEVGGAVWSRAKAA